MPTSQEYRRRAEECLELAQEADQFYVRTALFELAEDFKHIAEKLQGYHPLNRASASRK
jgi:hypothetical protein